MATTGNSKAARLRELNAAYAMVEDGCNLWRAGDADTLSWMSREAATLRGMVARDRRQFYAAQRQARRAA